MNDMNSDDILHSQAPNESLNFDLFLNLSYGIIGRTASTKFEPNTSSEFQFWLSKLGQEKVPDC